MSDLRRSRLTLIGVAALFVLPIVIAWWLAVIRPPQLATRLLNHGHFIQPPIDIATNGPLVALEQIPLAPGEWAVIYLSAGSCPPECKLVLERLSTIRSLLGHAGGRLTVAVAVDDQAVDMVRVRSIVDRQARTHFAGLLAARIAGADLPAIVLLDWRKQIMMFFPGDAESSGIKADLKRLLRGSTLR